MSSDLSKILQKIMPGIVIFLLTLLYFYYLPTSYDFDGTVFSQTLRTALIKNDLGQAIQVHHSLYYPANFYIYKALQISIGYNALEYFHLQLFSLLFGLLTLVVSYKILKKTIENITFHYIGIILIAFSYGFWYYSVEAEVHIAGLFFITLGFYYTFIKHDLSLKLRHIAVSSLCFAMAAGFHLTNGLIVISLCLIFIIEKRPFVKIFQFLLFYFFFFFMLMSIFFIFHKINPVDLFKTMLFGKDVLSGYDISYWAGFSRATLWNSLKSVSDGILFPATKMTGVLSVFLFLFSLSIILFAGFKEKGERIYYRLLLWMIPYFIFFTFWDPKKTEFKLNVILPLLILLTISFARLLRGKTKYILPVIFVLIVSAANLYFVISPAHDAQKNSKYVVAKTIGEKTGLNSIIVIAGIGSEISTFNKIYLPYFAHRKAYILDWALGRGISLAAIHAQIQKERAKGTAILFFSEITYLSNTLKKLLKNHNIKEEDYFVFLKSMNFKENIPLRDGYYLKPVE
jgi:hypothetical protein